MESAIAPALRCPRSQARRIDEDYAPSYPAWTARADPEVGQVVMGYFGVQWRGERDQGAAFAALAIIRGFFSLQDGPVHHDQAHCQDAAQYDTLIAIAYWTDPSAFQRWNATAELQAWWNDAERLTGRLGHFREILLPTAEAFETLFSASDRLEAVGRAMGKHSGDVIQEHGYWGSMRDRLAMSQTDRLIGSGELEVLAAGPGHGRRVTVKGAHNIAVIRSGQDWSGTAAHERRLYIDEMEPILRSGMDYLRDRGLEIACYSNRYMRCIDDSGQRLEKSFGHSIWRSLAAMEDWAESHPTHIAIFGNFMRITKELNFQVQLRLYHEVSVLSADQQIYEYLNCHPATGILNALGDSKQAPLFAAPLVSGA